MSHIPSSAMPHAQAHDDDIDGQPPQPEQRQPDPAPTTATPPLSSIAPGTTTGARQGSDADRTTRAAGEPVATATSIGQQPVQKDEQDRPGTQGAGERTGLRGTLSSRAGIAALALGGVAAVAGIVVAALPLLHDEQPKRKKAKKRKNG